MISILENILIIIIVGITLVISFVNLFIMSRKRNEFRSANPAEILFAKKLKEIGFNSEQEVISYIKGELKPIKMMIRDLSKYKNKNYPDINSDIKFYKETFENYQNIILSSLSLAKNNPERCFHLIKNDLEELSFHKQWYQEMIKCVVDRCKKICSIV